MANIKISDLQGHTELLIDLSDETAEPVKGGGFFSDALDGLLNWVNSGNDGSYSAGLATAGKGLLAMPGIVTLAAAAHGEHLITGH